MEHAGRHKHVTTGLAGGARLADGGAARAWTCAGPSAAHACWVYNIAFCARAGAQCLIYTPSCQGWLSSPTLWACQTARSGSMRRQPQLTLSKHLGGWAASDDSPKGVAEGTGSKAASAQLPPALCPLIHLFHVQPPSCCQRSLCNGTRSGEMGREEPFKGYLAGHGTFWRRVHHTLWWVHTSNQLRAVLHKKCMRVQEMACCQNCQGHLSLLKTCDMPVGN